MADFYSLTLLRLLEQEALTLDSEILVVCGGQTDWAAFYKLGFRNVTISNLDVRMKGNEFSPFAWSFQDVESLTYPGRSFDFVIAHQGLHHCKSPHLGLLEMFRVARTGILAFEPRDTFFVRLGIKLDFGQEYEVAAVAANRLAYGGVKNTPTPNYVYRWTEHEIEKTIHTGFPEARSRFQYFYSLRVPEERLRAMKNRVAAIGLKTLIPTLRAAAAVSPALTNCFAFLVEKPRLPRDLHPWMKLSGTEPTVNAEWVRARYGDFAVPGTQPPANAEALASPK